MKIKLYIVTYNNNEILKQNISRLYESDLQKYDYTIYVINNYSKINDRDILQKERLHVLDNLVRPDFSNGHLSRNWNQAIINGFESIKNPQSDIVVLMQNDTYVKQNCFSRLVDLHEKYSFIAMGNGDQFMSYTIDAVKNIGIWDERFCSIGYQEADYFLSAFVFNRDMSSINDYHHGRVHNAIYEKTESDKLLIEDYSSLNKQFHSFDWHDYNLKLFKEKWGIDPQSWNHSQDTCLHPRIKRYCYYPYFEKDILTLKEQNYFETDFKNMLHRF